MAEFRQGYLDDYSQQNGNVGIGTSISNEKLEIIGGTTAQELNVTGIATLTSVSGFIKKHTDYAENVNITAGDSGTLSGEIVVGAGLTMTVGTAATTSQGSVDSLKVSQMFQPPSGGTNQRPPGKPGALFYNFDFKTIEFFDGNSWRQVDNTTAAGRAVILGGNKNPSSVATSAIGAFNITSGGKETIFGDLVNGSNAGSGVGSRTRGVNTASTSPVSNTLTYVTIPSLGDSIVFGDLVEVSYRSGGSSSSDTRGLIFGGRGAPGNCHNVIQYLQIQTTGNALDFGDLVTTGEQTMASSPTRGVGIGGYGVGPSAPSGGRLTECQFVTTHTLGNAFEFANLQAVRNDANGCGNNVRGVFLGGGGSPAQTDAITFVEHASLGRPTDFGNLQSIGQSHACTSNKIRAVKTNGSTTPGGSVNRIEYVNIATGGDAVEFGDATYAGASSAAHCNAQGGL